MNLKKVKNIILIGILIMSIIILDRSLTKNIFANMNQVDQLTNAYKNQVTDIVINYNGKRYDDLSQPSLDYHEAKTSPRLTTFERQNLFGTNYKSTFSRNSDGSINLKTVSYKLRYKNTSSDISYTKEHIRSKIKEWDLNSKDEYTQLRVPYDYIIDTFNYGIISKNDQDWGNLIAERNLKLGLEGKPVVCDAYAMLYSLFLDELGYTNYIATAEIKDRTGQSITLHAWNVVETTQGLYNVDATWGDSPNQNDRDFNFLKTKDELTQGYIFSPLEYYPLAESTSYKKINEKPEEEVVVKPEEEETPPKEVGPVIDNGYSGSTSDNTNTNNTGSSGNTTNTANTANTANTGNTGNNGNNGIPEDINIDNIVYINGYKDNTFKGDNYITREEAVSIINNLLIDDNKEEVNTFNFKDIKPNKWSYKAIQNVANKGIVTGYSNNEFKPENNITRAEAITIMLKYSGKQFELGKEHWADNYINYAIKNNIISGYEDGTIRPNNNITRAEFVVIMNKILGNNPKDFSNLKKYSKFKDINNKWYELDVILASTIIK